METILVAGLTGMALSYYFDVHDLLQIAAVMQQQGIQFAGLIFSHQQGTSIGQCVEDLELIAQCMTPDEAANRVIYVPLQ